MKSFFFSLNFLSKVTIFQPCGMTHRHGGHGCKHANTQTRKHTASVLWAESFFTGGLFLGKFCPRLYCFTFKFKSTISFKMFLKRCLNLPGNEPAVLLSSPPCFFPQGSRRTKSRFNLLHKGYTERSPKLLLVHKCLAIQVTIYHNLTRHTFNFWGSEGR